MQKKPDNTTANLLLGINLERFFALLIVRQVRRGIHRSTRELERAIRHYLEVYNETAEPFVWTKAADQIFASVA